MTLAPVLGPVMLGPSLLGQVQLGEVPLDPSREQARSWALEELGKREYTSRAPGLVARAMNWVLDKFSRLDLPSGAGNAVVAGIVLVLLVALGWVAFRYAGGLRREARGAGAAPVLGAAVRTAREHRDAARELAGAGQWRDAAVERFRALARQLEEDGVLSPAPGRTAGELAREVTRLSPALGPAVARAATVFDDVRYGDHEAGPAQEAAIGAVDDEVRGRRHAGAGA